MSGGGTWTLSLESEVAYLIPWLDTNPDPNTRQLVLQYLAELLNWPWRPECEDDEAGYYSGTIPGTQVGVIWLIEEEKRLVVLAHLG